MATLIIDSSKDYFSNTPTRGINYILREDKCIYKTFFGCDEKNVFNDFKNLFDNRLNPRQDNITYYHIKQTFAPTDNINYKTAHEIGQILANDFSNKGHQVILSTHNDTRHIHNHLIISSVSMDNMKVIKQDKKWFYGYRNLNDDILSRYNLLTCADLKEQNNISNKNSIYENRLLENGAVTDKIKIIDILNKYIYDDKINNIYSMIKKINSSEEFSCHLRGKTLTFTSPEGKKYRPATISKEFSTESIEKKLIGIYTKENHLYDFITDLSKNASCQDDFFESLQKENIKYKMRDNEIYFENSSLRDIIGKPFNILQKEFYLKDDMNIIKDNLKNLVSNNNFNSINDFIYETLKIDLIISAKLHKNSIIFESENGSFDFYKISDPAFNIKNIKQNIFINNHKSMLKEALDAGTCSNIFDYFQQNNIKYDFNNNQKIYFYYDEKKININKILNLKENKFLYNEFIKTMNNFKNSDDFFNDKNFVFDSQNKIFIFKNSLFLKDFTFKNFKLTPANIQNICAVNKLDEILKKSYSYDEFLKKYKLNQININYDEEKVKEQINNNFTRKNFFKSIKNTYSMEEFFSKVSASKFFNVETFNDDIIFKNKQNNCFYKSSMNFLEDNFLKNQIKRDIFISLKISSSINDFKQNLIDLGHTIFLDEKSIIIDEINIESLGFKNKYGENLFCISEIKERLNQNFDFQNKNSIPKSLKSQFNQIYFNNLKNSTSLDSFKIKLIENNTFDFKFIDDNIYFKEKNKSEYINSDKYNFKNTEKFYGLNAAEKIIDKNNMNHNIFFVTNLVKLLDYREKTREDNINKVRLLKYIRIKNEMKNKNKR